MFPSRWRFSVAAGCSEDLGITVWQSAHRFLIHNGVLVDGIHDRYLETTDQSSASLISRSNLSLLYTKTITSRPDHNSWPNPSVHSRDDPPSDLPTILFPILAILPSALLLIPPLAMHEQDSKVDHVEVRDGNRPAFHTLRADESSARVEDRRRKLVARSEGR